MLAIISSEYAKERVDMVDEFLKDNLKKTGVEFQESALHLPSAGGKRLRPLLILLSSEMFDVNPERVLPIAAGIESLHTSTLIQDDHPDMDDDKLRRGVQSVHERFGGAEAQLVSNILLSKSYKWTSESAFSGDIKSDCISEIDRTIEDLCIGQKMDLDFENRSNVREEEYYQMIYLKTASMYESSAKIGGIVSKSDQDTKKKLSEFGRHLGIGFQIIDDVIDIECEDTSKDNYSDIRNNKTTLVTLDAKRNGVPVFNEDVPVEERAQMIREAGSIEYARKEAESHIDKSIEYLDGLRVECEDARSFLRKMVASTSKRNY
jgi:geranylgeranyl diphosphate synthase type I